MPVNINPKISINIPIGSLGLKILRSTDELRKIIINKAIPYRKLLKSN